MDQHNFQVNPCKYIIQMQRQDLSRCIQHSSSPWKLALNLLVSLEDCQYFTVYGQGKTKKQIVLLCEGPLKVRLVTLLCAYLVVSTNNFLILHTFFTPCHTIVAGYYDVMLAFHVSFCHASISLYFHFQTITCKYQQIFNKLGYVH